MRSHPSSPLGLILQPFSFQRSTFPVLSPHAFVHRDVCATLGFAGGLSYVYAPLPRRGNGVEHAAGASVCWYWRKSFQVVIIIILMLQPQLEGRLSKFPESVKKHSKDFSAPRGSRISAFHATKKAIRLLGELSYKLF